MIVVVGKNEFVKFVVGEPEHKVSLSVVRSEFSKLKIYDDDQWTEKPIFFDKVSIDGMKGYLHSQAGASEIVDYYRSSARAIGWSEVDVRQGASGGRSIKFCKGGVSFVVDVLKNDPGQTGSDYYFALTWTDDRGLDSYCPPSDKT